MSLHAPCPMRAPCDVTGARSICDVLHFFSDIRRDIKQLVRVTLRRVGRGTLDHLFFATERGNA